MKGTRAAAGTRQEQNTGWAASRSPRRRGRNGWDKRGHRNKRNCRRSTSAGDVCELVMLFLGGDSTGPALGAGRGAAAKRCRGVWGAGPLRRGEFERGIPLSCCRPGKALFIPYNSVLYKKGRPHRPVKNTGGRPGANRPGFSRFAFCIRSSYTVGAPAAISRRNAPRVIKSARAGNAVDVRRRRCADYVDAPRRRRGVDVGSGGRLRLCALVGPGGLPVPGGCGRRAYSRRRPEQAQTPVQKHAQNWD